MMLPKISVVTITRNDLVNLQKTVESVTSQDYPNLEFIVIDGYSSDGTQDFLHASSTKYTTWISEPDQGIYDAMNKGTQNSSGEWVVFMNAGDTFASKSTITKVFSSVASEKFDLLGGRCAFVNSQGNTTTEFPNRPIDELWKGMPISHQTLFSRRRLLLERPFSLDLKVAADFQFLYNSVKAGAKLHILDLFIAKTDQDGVSRTNRALSLKERKNIVTKQDKRIRVSIFYTGLRVKTYLRTLAIRYLPSSVSNSIVRIAGREKTLKEITRT